MNTYFTKSYVACDNHSDCYKYYTITRLHHLFLSKDFAKCLPRNEYVAMSLVECMPEI